MVCPLIFLFSNIFLITTIATWLSVEVASGWTLERQGLRSHAERGNDQWPFSYFMRAKRKFLQVLLQFVSGFLNFQLS